MSRAVACDEEEISELGEEILDLDKKILDLDDLSSKMNSKLKFIKRSRLSLQPMLRRHQTMNWVHEPAIVRKAQYFNSIATSNINIV